MAKQLLFTTRKQPYHFDFLLEFKLDLSPSSLLQFSYQKMQKIIVELKHIFKHIVTLALRKKNLTLKINNTKYHHHKKNHETFENANVTLCLQSVENMNCFLSQSNNTYLV
jgi:hypothetical protein